MFKELNKNYVTTSQTFRRRSKKNIFVSFETTRGKRETTLKHFQYFEYLEFIDKYGINAISNGTSLGIQSER